MTRKKAQPVPPAAIRLPDGRIGSASLPGVGRLDYFGRGGRMFCDGPDGRREVESMAADLTERRQAKS